MGNWQTMKQLVTEFHDRRGNRIKQSTLDCERSTLLKMSSWWDNTHRSPKSLTEYDLEEFLDGPTGLQVNSRGGTLAASTYNTQLQHLKPFLRWLRLKGVLDFDVMTTIGDARRTPASREYTRLALPQIHRMIETADDPWERWVVAFAAFTFGRHSELLMPRLFAFDADHGTIRWYRQKVDDYDDLPIFADLDREYRRWLIAYQDAVGEPVQKTWFLTPARFRNRTRVWYYDPDRHPAQVATVIKAHAARALGVPVTDLKNEAAHILRRSGARAFYDQLVAAGTPDPIRIVMAMLGHVRQATTEDYLGIRADRERRDQLVIGSDIMSLPTENVVQLRGRDHG